MKDQDLTIQQQAELIVRKHWLANHDTLLFYSKRSKEYKKCVNHAISEIDSKIDLWKDAILGSDDKNRHYYQRIMDILYAIHYELHQRKYHA